MEGRRGAWDRGEPGLVPPQGAFPGERQDDSDPDRLVRAALDSAGLGVARRPAVALLAQTREPLPQGAAFLKLPVETVLASHREPPGALARRFVLVLQAEPRVSEQ